MRLQGVVKHAAALVLVQAAPGGIQGSGGGGGVSFVQVCVWQYTL